MNFFWDDYKQALRKEIETQVDYLAAGKAASFDRYREVVGRIKGLKEALNTLDNCLKKAGEIEDE